MRRSILLVLLSLLVACGSSKPEGPTCEQVTDKILEVTKMQLPGHENTGLAHQRKAMIAQCEKKQMPVEVRTCIMGAKTISEIGTCRGRGKSSVRERPRRPRGPSLGSSHIGSGSARAGSAGSGSAGSGSPAGSGSGSAK